MRRASVQKGAAEGAEDRPVDGTIESVWRYPVKSMAGEAVARAFIGHEGVIGDRRYALRSDSRAARFPWFTGRQYPDLIRHRARYVERESTLAPVNPEASRPTLPADDAFAVEIETPAGILVDLHDPMFLAGLPLKDGESVEPVASPRAFVDVAPVSLISMQSIAALGAALGMALDPRRFRMNLHVDWASGDAFAEDELVGRTLRIGETVEIAVLERDARCKMIALDPETGAETPAVLKHVLDERGGCAGTYAAVLREGFVQKGDAVRVL